MLRFVRNKVILYIASRYLSYFIQFINSLLVAYVLGPFYLGIWGFVTLVLQYLAFGNLGIDIALNVRLSTGNLGDSRRQSETASNALLATLATSGVLLLAGGLVQASGMPLFEKYGFSKFAFVTVVISCLNYFNVVFLNICRTYSKLTPITVFQTLLQILQLPVLFIYRDTALIWALLAMMVLGHLISIVFFLKNLPFRPSLKGNWKEIAQLYRRGLSLLGYAITFYILLMSTRSMIGYFYPVEVMGRFTFACNIATALIVGLSSLEFVLFPKMINRLSASEIDEHSVRTLGEVRFIYMSSAMVVVLIGLICYPALLLFFGQYTGTVHAFNYLVMSQVIISAGFGYTTLIISRQKEHYLIVHGIIALLVNLVLAAAAWYLLEPDYSIMPAILLVAFLYYDYQVIKMGRNMMGAENNFRKILAELLPLPNVVSFALVFAGMALGAELIFDVLALVSFIVMNIRKYTLVRQYISRLLHSPSVVNIQS
jgi:O-antigen/teichoic acid export membrane protein